MFWRDRIGIRGGGVILYIKDYIIYIKFIQVYEIKTEREADYDEAGLCNIVQERQR